MYSPICTRRAGHSFPWLPRLATPARAVAALALLCLSGCAAWKEKLAPQPSVSEQRNERRSSSLHAFEHHRDQAQLAAALDRFQQGDLNGCHLRLEALVDRRPDLHEARLRLAEVCWALNDAVTAEQHFRAVLAAQPHLPEAQHGLGMLLVAHGRFDEAQPYLARAAELDPDNDAYQQARLP
jgi:predicted Zn-dependent protease